MVSASNVSRTLATQAAIKKLEATTQRQVKQLVREDLGIRRQGKPPWPMGSRPALRIQHAANERRSKAKAESDRIAAEEAERLEELEAERQIEEEARLMEAMEAAEAGHLPVGSSLLLGLLERLVTTRVEVDATGQVKLTLTATPATPKRVARLEAAAKRREEARANAERLERERLAAEAAEAARYAALGTTRWKWADKELAGAFLRTRGVNLDAGAWLLAQQLCQCSHEWRATCLQWCRGVRRLSLRAGPAWNACKWTRGVMEAIHRTSPDVTALELNGFDGEALHGIELISPFLEELTLAESTDVGPMLEATAFPELETFRLVDCHELSSDALRTVAREWDRLRTLHLEGASITRSFIISFARELPAGTRLESIECTEPFPDDAIKAMSKTCPNLRSMMLPIAGPYALREPPRCFPSLRRMWLGLQPKMGTKRAPCWTDDELKALAEGCPQLSELRLEEGGGGVTALTGASLAAFGKRLTDLSLARLPSMLDTGAMIKFAEAAGASLRRVNLADCRIRDPDTVVAALLRECVLLEHLDISGVDQLLMRTPFESVGCAGLRHLDLGAGRLGSGCAVEAGATLSVIAACPQLTTLRLGNAQTANKIRMELLRLDEARLSTLALIRDDGYEEDELEPEPAATTAMGMADMGSVVVAAVPSLVRPDRPSAPQRFSGGEAELEEANCHTDEPVGGVVEVS